MTTTGFIIALVISFIAGKIAGFCLGYLFGHDRGSAVMEQRWREANEQAYRKVDMAMANFARKPIKKGDPVRLQDAPDDWKQAEQSEKEARAKDIWRGQP